MVTWLVDSYVEVNIRVASKQDYNTICLYHAMSLIYVPYCQLHDCHTCIFDASYTTKRYSIHYMDTND